MLVDILDVNNSVQLQYWVLLLCSIAMEGTEPSIKIQYTVSSWHTLSMILYLDTLGSKLHRADNNDNKMSRQIIGHKNLNLYKCKR